MLQPVNPISLGTPVKHHEKHAMNTTTQAKKPSPALFSLAAEERVRAGHHPHVKGTPLTGLRHHNTQL